jgi:hypothetical protein
LADREGRVAGAALPDIFADPAIAIGEDRPLLAEGAAAFDGPLLFLEPLPGDVPLNGAKDVPDGDDLGMVKSGIALARLVRRESGGSAWQHQAKHDRQRSHLRFRR